MGNNADKKYFSALHNKRRVERLAAEEALRLDKIENPDKYRSSKAALHHARMFMAVAAGFGVNSC